MSDPIRDSWTEKIHPILDSAFDAVIMMNPGGSIRAWNLRAEELFGWTRREALGQDMASLIVPEELKASFAAGFERYMKSGEKSILNRRVELQGKRKNGELFPIELSVREPDDDADPIFIGFIRDLTESNAARDAIQRSQNELLTAKQRAETSEQKTLDAMRVRGEFLANVSHELRTPMNAIIGMAQLALAEELSDEVRGYIETAHQSAHSLLTLLNDILDFSKIESGKFTIDREPFRLRDMIDETLKTLSNTAFEKGLELVCEVDPDAPNELFGDPTRLRQVLTNLLSNAVKFTDRGEVLLQVAVIRNLSREVRLEFSVSDTGMGISDDDQHLILQPFTQADTSSTRKYSGTGLGLAICNELVRLMGGRMVVESVLGSGSKFSFQLTLDREVENDASPQGAIPMEELKKMRVLIVDDNQTNRRILKKTFENWSMEPEVAADGVQAVGMINKAVKRGEPFPLVIVDALMPSIDGYDLSQKINETLGEQTPVILMASSTDRQNFRDKEEAAGISAFLSKPVSQSDLLDAVLQAMNVNILETPPAESTIEHSSPFQNLRVLLAEDTPANQKVVMAVLKKRGHAVVVANNGREATELYKPDKFDVVLMDVQMPIMDGYQATAAIRKMEEDYEKSTPIIAMTAHAMKGDREKCLEAGMDSYISKPIEVAALIELVESVAISSIDKSHAPSSTSKPSTATESEIIGYKNTMQRLGGSQELFRDFIRFFKEDSPVLLEQIDAALKKPDAPIVERAAHSIKGLAANFDAHFAVETASEIERLAKDDSLDDAAKLLPELRVRIDAVLQALQQYDDE